MLFNSFLFLLFFPAVVIGYYLIPKLQLKNVFLLIASYYFYMNLNPVYGLLLFISTIITYLCGLGIEKHQAKKKSIVSAGLVLNFSILFVFKYYNFINESFNDLFSLIGVKWNVPYLDFLLPVGISFYTFQAAGYIIDVYKKKIDAEKDFFTYALFVSFFPVILAGPIQRANILLPQLKKFNPFTYENLVIGSKLMLWGFFMKLCVADRLGTYVDAVYGNVDNHTGTSILLAAIFYSIQIYCDFSGYSLVAIGCSRVMGFKLPDNFKRPYFSTSIKEFWKRWHIALSSWFMDYLYIPLGGNRVKYWRYLVNLMIVFLVSGLWHGAAWTFIFWGGIHGLLLVVMAIKTKLFGKTTIESGVYKFVCTVTTFILVTIAWIFFRVPSINDAFIAIVKIFTAQGALFMSPLAMLYGMLSILILLIKDFADEYYPKLTMLNSSNRLISIPTTAVIFIYIILFGVIDNSQFIYFQF